MAGIHGICLLVEGRMSISEWLHWLATGRASSLKVYAPITSHGMYFSSTPLSSLPSLLLSEKDMVCRMVDV